METSISAADPAKYYWMRMSDKGRTVTSDAGEKIKIDPKALFGVRELRGKPLDEILLQNGTRFKLSIQKSESLMDLAKPFTGKTPVIKRTEIVPVKQAKLLTKTVAPVKVKVKPTPFKKTEILVKPSKTKIKVVADKDARKATETHMTIMPNGHPTIKLKDLHLPELDEFTDTSLPEEFRRYQTVESTGVKVEKLKVSFSDADKPGI